jgi:predicted amidophosphoribosyltransferase
LDSTPRKRISNKGGGYVKDVGVARVGSGHILRFRGPTGALKQVHLTDSRYQPLKSFEYHKLRGVGPAPAQVTTQLLDLLREVLTVRCRDELDYALALDWYKIPSDEIASRAWLNTPLGEHVHRGKYWHQIGEDVAVQKASGRALVGQLVPVIRQHPLLCDIAAIVSVPGHDSKIVSFGARLAEAVAKAVGKPAVRCSAVEAFRPSVKTMAPADRATKMHNQFVCGEDVGGLSLLIIDDVYGSGSTAAETARAVRAAGAARVSSLCAVRTMKI